MLAHNQNWLPLLNSNCRHGVNSSSFQRKRQQFFFLHGTYSEFCFSFCFYSCGWFFICTCFCICIGVFVCIGIYFCIGVLVIFSVCLSNCICILKGNTLTLNGGLSATFKTWLRCSTPPYSTMLHSTLLCLGTPLGSTVHWALQGHLHCLQSYHRSYLAHIGTSSTLSPMSLILV